MFSSTMPTLFGRPNAIITGNESLQTVFLQLRNLTDSLSAREADASYDVRHLLTELTAELHAYFNAEETDEYFGTLINDCPNLKRRVEKLGAAHAGFRKRVGGLQQLASDETRAPELAVGIEQIIVDFEQHEQAETEVLQDFFCNDGLAEEEDVVT